MKFDPQKHHRRTIRIKGYDYTQAGAYFVTLVTYNREALFGEIINDEIRPNGIGSVITECWNNLPGHFPNLTLDEFILMPNHIRCRGEASASQGNAQPGI